MRLRTVAFLQEFQVTLIIGVWIGFIVGFIACALFSLGGDE